MTQPAASHALERLRAWFDDELLVRGNFMVLTPRAEALIEPVGEVLERVRALSNVDQLPPAETERTLRLSMVDFVAAALLPPLLAALSRQAPSITLACLDWASPSVELDHLRHGHRDLVLTVLKTAPRDLASSPLGHIDYVGSPSGPSAVRDPPSGSLRPPVRDRVGGRTHLHAARRRPRSPSSTGGRVPAAVLGGAARRRSERPARLRPSSARRALGPPWRAPHLRGTGRAATAAGGSGVAPTRRGRSRASLRARADRAARQEGPRAAPLPPHAAGRSPT
ncbi:MAG TPA: LysR family transcriptional regulator [Polyangiaceae bacterium]|nr:LysR family transcriptional regulator [Polyangiaceae bacterium]